MAHDLPAPTRSLDQATRDMAEHGYALVADALDTRQVDAMTTRLVEQALAEGPVLGVPRTMDDEHLRFDVGALLNKGSIFLELLDPGSFVHQLVDATLAAAANPVNGALWNLEQRFILGSLDGIVKRLEVETSGDRKKQAHLNPVFHFDQAMVPHWIDFPVAVNCFFFLTEYTRENGATLVVPGTHLRPPGDLSSYSAGDGLPVEAPAGTALLVDGRLVHAAGLNTNGELRITLDAYYNAPWIRQRWPMSMNLCQEVVDLLTDAQLRLCGFDTMYQSEYGSYAGPGIIEPTLGRHNVTVKQLGLTELHLT